MNWAHGLKHKLIASISLFTLCLMVLLSNYIDRDHTENVKQAINTLYEDRLVAEEYILRMTVGFYRLREILASEGYQPDNQQEASRIIGNILAIDLAYQATKFTDLERQKADELLSVAREISRDISLKGETSMPSVDRALTLLNELSAIQLEESKNIMNRAEKLYASGRKSSRFVFAIIIVILVVLQAIVVASRPMIPLRRSGSAHLN